ncbi:hypothetical protein DPEC_G00101630 [Dallia pectoralis]|uniref:Uncharacterized protein n=1 Tax=Dallia pectoralis TaxID=75939 RepID=A0ACC2GXE5_DALPE|nr:hypothetical protein DPEC_G00101630 [Dallia pectoralis]
MNRISVLGRIILPQRMGETVNRDKRQLTPRRPVWMKAEGGGEASLIHLIKLLGRASVSTAPHLGPNCKITEILKLWDDGGEEGVEILTEVLSGRGDATSRLTTAHCYFANAKKMTPENAESTKPDRNSAAPRAQRPELYPRCGHPGAEGLGFNLHTVT